MNPRNLAVATTIDDGKYWPDRVALAECDVLTPEDIAPYRALLEEYLSRADTDDEDVDLDAVLREPRTWNVTVPRFFHWLAATHPDRLTDPSPSGDTLPEGDPVTTTTTPLFNLDLISSVDEPAASDYVMHLTWPDAALEPFRERLILAAMNMDVDPLDRVGAEARITGIITGPRAWFVTLPGYFRWLREHGHLPELQLSPEGDAEPVVFQVGDRVRYNNDERNFAIAQGERIVSEVHSNTVVLVHPPESEIAGQHANSNVHFERLELVSRAEPEPEQQPESGLTAPGGSTFHLGDRVRLAMYDGPKEATVTDSGAHNPDPMGYPVVWTDLHGSPTWIGADVVTLVSCPHAEGTAPTEQPVPQGDSEPVVIPWGPAHPEWEGWWARARQTAERFGYGSHYDILAERLGGPSRTQYDLVEVTVRVQVERDAPVTRAAIADGVHENGFAVLSRIPR